MKGILNDQIRGSPSLRSGLEPPDDGRRVTAVSDECSTVTQKRQDRPECLPVPRTVIFCGKNQKNPVLSSKKRNGKASSCRSLARKAKTRYSADIHSILERGENNGDAKECFCMPCVLFGRTTHDLHCLEKVSYLRRIEDVLRQR